MSSRISAGGLGNNCTAADAKKNNYPIFAAPKHTVKGSVSTLDLGAPTPAASPAKGLKPPSNLPGVKGLKAPTNVKAGKPSPRSA